MKNRLGILFLVFSITIFGASNKVRIKEIARIEGVRNNQLIGMGLVVGLNGTGDSGGLTPQMLSSLYSYFGTEISNEQIASKNVAAVMLTAELPPFKKVGDTIDVTVSSVNDAQSLEGGVLLNTQLLAGNKEVYAIAQGSLTRVNKGNLNNGFLQDGATVEREVEIILENKDKINLILNNPDFTTASRVSDEINRRFNYDTAKALDASIIEIKKTFVFDDDVVSFISAIENLEVIPDRKSIILINEKTGTIVLGDNIKVAPVAISHGDLSIAISAELDIDITRESGGNDGDKGQSLYFKGTTVKDVVKMLNSIGATPDDIVSILQALKKSGSIDAEITIM
jgi:flagellar P-ring protein precursor FlgI